MKTIDLNCLLLLSILFIPTLMNAQSLSPPTTPSGTKTPVVKFEQGELIGNLPYGRHFYIQGTIKQPNNLSIDRVEISIYDGGSLGWGKKKKEQVNISEAAVGRIISQSNNLINTASWNKYEAVTASDPNPTNFNVYFNTPLQFNRQYLLRFSYLKTFDFDLTKDEKTVIINSLKTFALNLANKNGEIALSDIKAKLNSLVTNKLKEKVAASEETFFDIDKIQQNIHPVKERSLQQLSEIIPQIPFVMDDINNLKVKLEDSRSLQDTMAADNPDLVSLTNQIKSNENKLKNAQSQLSTLEKNLEDQLQVIKNQIIIVQEKYAIGGSNETSVTELQAIRIGSSFGGGFVGLDFLDGDNRGYDAFGYTALKFYFLPVDKRVANPYLDGVFLLNRMSFIFGVATNSNFNYKGVELNKAFTVTPMVGLGVDLNRFFSIDLGATVFKQNAVSGFSTDENIRIGPVLGLNFDIDIFNRFSALFTGNKYSITPGE